MKTRSLELRLLHMLREKIHRFLGERIESTVALVPGGDAFVPRITKRYYLALDRRRRVHSLSGTIDGETRVENRREYARMYVCGCVCARAYMRTRERERGRGQVTTKH